MANSQARHRARQRARQAYYTQGQWRERQRAQERQGRYTDSMKTPSMLYLQLTYSGEEAKNLEQNVSLVYGIMQRIARQVNQSWHQLWHNGQGPIEWAPLAPQTIDEKRRRGDAEPQMPNVGTGQFRDALESMQPMITVTRRNTGYIGIIDFGPDPTLNLAPSERVQDLFSGSPHDFADAAAFGTQGAIPARPMAFGVETTTAVVEDIATMDTDAASIAPVYSQQDHDALTQMMLFDLGLPDEIAPEATSAPLYIDSGQDSSPMYLLEES